MARGLSKRDAALLFGPMRTSPHAPAPVARPEQALHRAAYELLTLLVGRSHLVLHVPNGGARSRTEAAILKGLGTRAGAPDLLIIGPRFAGWIELKADRGRLSPAQEEFRAECERKGIPWALARSLEEVEEAVVGWGLCAAQLARKGRT